MNIPCFFHVDLDAFFASVEQLDNPEYRGKPVIVGSLPTDRRGVVSTCSYEARQYGVHSAMPIGRAFALCPSGIFLRGRMKRYHEKSREVMAVLNRFSPDVQQMSIDEAFMDMSGTERLFGVPEKAARRLKESVRDETGLTLSIGAASNKYIAKIASGMSKPDGLFIVENGKEEDFMLSLSLKKIWGVGEKTLDRITKAGFRTPRDLHKASLNLLQSLFGSCTGSFLYHAVRGCEVETFDTQTKSRSISSEHTFSFDLTDLYTIDTALLELSWEIMYRLLTENVRSKTVHVKIRYEDFTTVSVQETSGRFISSADDLFFRAQNLFRKKYESGRGIRLLGLAAQNIEDTSDAVQSELFDFGEKKKAAVEKAVIQIQKKNPGIRVEKARLLNAKEELQPNKTPAQKIKPHAPKDTSLFSAILPVIVSALFGFWGIWTVFCFSFGFLHAQMPAQNSFPQNSAFSNEAGDVFDPLAALPKGRPFASFSLTSPSDEVEFFVKGSWEAKFFGHHIIGLNGTDNKKPVLSFSPPVFMQKTDLMLWFFLNKKWYFEAAVADAYDKSTVAAGYYGDGVLRHARIGNRGIGFPRIYGIDSAGKGTGGAADSAPGITAHWETASWQADALLRYDLLETFEKNWTGANELGEKKIGLYEWKTGLRFALPAGRAHLISSVYIESEKGDYKDSEGYTYTKLADSDYLLLTAQDVLVLARPALGRVLAEFYGGKDSVADSLGGFSAAGSFLKAVQDCFNSAYKPENFSYPPKTGIATLNDFFTEVAPKAGGSTAEALILQYPPFFSPFVDASLYEADFAPQSASVSVLTASGTVQDSYAAIETEGGLFENAVSGSDFFKEKKNYIRLFNRSVSGTGTGSASQGLSPQERYPAAKDNPLAYLSPKNVSPGTGESPFGKADTKPLFISVQTSARTEVLDIGTNALPGSIVMYRNGIKETGFRYDEKTGMVHPIRPVSAFDKVRIVWQQRKESGKNGRISAAAGIRKSFSNDFFLDGSASLLWPLTQKDSFSCGGESAGGSLNAALKLDLQKQDFSLSDTSVISFEMPDATGVRRVLSMDDAKPKKILLTEKAAAVFPEEVVPVLKKRPDLSSPAVPTLNVSKRGILKTEILREGGNEGYAAGMDWTIRQDGGWVVQTIDFSKNAASLASAREFSLWLKTADSNLTNAEIYLQLGAPETAQGSSVLGESQVSIPTWKISDNPSLKNDVKQSFDVTKAGIWQKVGIRLRDEDRMQLAKNQNARLIIYFPTAPGASQQSGKLFAGAAEINGTVFVLSAPQVCSLYSSGHTSPVAETAEMLRFNRDGVNTVQYFKWHIPNGETPENGTVSARIYTEAVNLASYDTMNFFMYVPKIDAATAEMPDFSLVLQSETNRGIETALHLVIKKEAFEKIKSEPPPQGTWKKVQFDLRRQSLSVDGTELTADTDFSVKSFDINTAANRIEFAFAPRNTQTPPPLGTKDTVGELYIDELYLEGRDYRLNFENIFSFDWNKKNTLWEIKGFPLAANPRFYTNIHANAASGNLHHKNSKGSVAAAADTGAQIDIAGIETSGNISFSLASAAHTNRYGNHRAGGQAGNIYTLQSAGHRIRTTPVFLVTRIFNASEDYSFMPQSATAQKTEAFSLDFMPLKQPLFLSWRSQGTLGPFFQKQDASLEGHWSAETEKMTYKIRVSAQTFQQGKSRIKKTEQKPYYFSDWLDVSKIQFSSGESNADLRRLGFSMEQNFGFLQNRFTPSIIINAQNIYRSALKTEYTAKDALTLSFPFTVNRQQFSIAWTKNTAVSDTAQKGGSYMQDSLRFAESMPRRKDSYLAVPLYDFFDPKLAPRIQKNGFSLSTYESLWDLSWKRPLFSSPLDIAVPSRLIFAVSRNIKTSPQDISDMLQFKTGAGFTAFNCFGSFGSAHLWNWYEQDEYASFMSLTFKADRSQIKKYRIDFSGYNQVLFFFNAKDNLRLFTEYRIDTARDWQTKFTVEWDRLGKTSIVKDGLEFLLLQFNKAVKNEKNFSVGLRRKNAFNAVIGNTEADILMQNYVLSHNVDFELNSYLRTGLFLTAEVSIRNTMGAAGQNAGTTAFSLKNSGGISAKLTF